MSPGRVPLSQPAFVPMSLAEMRVLGWDELDVLLISGDAYVDHPSIACALLGRWLIAHGYRTGIVTQPGWDTPDNLLAMGRPRLFCGIGAGAVDSMVAHYTAFRKKRHDDAYTPGGRAGARPNRASIVYANLARRAFPGVPLVLGGIEASLRRVTHYDFWTDALRRPILMDAKADLLVWGMGERAILAIARRLDEAGADADLTGIDGTAWMARTAPDGLPGNLPPGYSDLAYEALPSHQALLENRDALLVLTKRLERQVHRGDAWAFEDVSGRSVVLAPPAAPLSTEEMDAVYGLPFNRKSHPAYKEPVPAQAMLATSITSHRGCGGGCSFCALAIHQTRHISSRSRESLIDEARRMAARKKGGRGLAISDVGGPTANMWQAHCALEDRCAARRAAAVSPQSAQTRRPVGDAPEPRCVTRCRKESCCYPSVCPSFIAPQREHVSLLRAIRDLPGVSQVRVASGIRADLAMRDPRSMDAYTGEFTGGQLKVAPEHCVAEVLALMRKPGIEVFEAFLESFVRQSRQVGREQYVVPYLMSGFPGCTDEDMRILARWLAARHWTPQQTQCFIPTPGSMATAMFWCGKTENGEPIYVARTDAERLRQHRILMPAAGADPRATGGRFAKKPPAGRGADRDGVGAGQSDARRGRAKGGEGRFDERRDSRPPHARGGEALRDGGRTGRSRPRVAHTERRNIRADGRAPVHADKGRPRPAKGKGES